MTKDKKKQLLEELENIEETLRWSRPDEQHKLLVIEMLEYIREGLKEGRYE